MLTLTIIKDKNGPGYQGPAKALVDQVCEATLTMYKTAGFQPPWVCYWVYEENGCVGTCGFKYPPEQNKVEIAYFTFPEYEGKGYATLMAAELVTLARRQEPRVRVTARTLPQRNASVRVLEKNGFVLAGEVDDPQDGVVWEWWLVKRSFAFVESKS